MEGLAIPDVLISAERHAPTSQETVTANIYSTREIKQLTINGETQNWHSLKGGTKKKEITENDAPSYEVLYNPQQGQWLKIVPPNLPRNLATENLQRLQASAAIQRKACEVAGLPELANNLQEVTVQFPDGRQTYGIITPHFGASLEYLLQPFFDGEKKRIIRGRLPDNAKKFGGEIYRRAFNQATDLWLTYGYLAKDANPGNILLHGNNGALYPLLIDFSNAGSIPQPELPLNTKKRLARDYTEKIVGLYNNFRDQCRNYDIPITFTTEDATKRIKEIVEARADLPEG